MMLTLINILALLITVGGIVLLVKPELILDFISRHAQSQGMFAFAIVIRLLLGLLLITYAGLSRFPKTVIFFGWVAVIAAVVIAWMGQARFSEFVTTVIDKVSPYGRAGGVAALLFGLFLLYAFL